MKVGYKRVSTPDQNPDRQLINLELDRVFLDKASANSLDRPELQILLAFVRDGDEVFVHSMDRLARNAFDLRKIVEHIISKNCSIRFMKENLIFDTSTNATSYLMLNLMGLFADFERSVLRERQLEGIALAKKKGKYKGRPRSFTEDGVKKMMEYVEAGYRKDFICNKFKISLPTYKKYVEIGSKEKGSIPTKVSDIRDNPSFESLLIEHKK